MTAQRLLVLSNFPAGVINVSSPLTSQTFSKIPMLKHFLGCSLLWQSQTLLWAGLDGADVKRCIYGLTASWWGLSLSFHVFPSSKKGETHGVITAFPPNVTAMTCGSNFMLVFPPAERVRYRVYCLCWVDQLNFIFCTAVTCTDNSSRLCELLVSGYFLTELLSKTATILRKRRDEWKCKHKKNIRYFNCSTK